MDIKKRPHFQYHLSTLVIITILAGILLGAHVRPRIFIDNYGNIYPQYGFPFVCYERIGITLVYNFKFYPFYSKFVYAPPFLIGLLNFTIVLLPIALLLEALIRNRSEAAKKRELFKVHLLPLLLTVSLGVFILKLNYFSSNEIIGEWYSVNGGISSFQFILKRGWPKPTYRFVQEVKLIKKLELGDKDSDEKYNEIRNKVRSMPNFPYTMPDIFYNLLGAGIIIFATLFFSEWAYRRWLAWHRR